jgi:hypothetical protein
MTLDGNSEIKAEDWLIVFEAGEAQSGRQIKKSGKSERRPHKAGA